MTKPKSRIMRLGGSIVPYDYLKLNKSLAEILHEEEAPPKTLLARGEHNRPIRLPKRKFVPCEQCQAFDDQGDGKFHCKSVGHCIQNNTENY